MCAIYACVAHLTSFILSSHLVSYAVVVADAIVVGGWAVVRWFVRPIVHLCHSLKLDSFSRMVIQWHIFAVRLNI